MISYPVMRGNDIVGEAILQQEGMFWKISCSCNFPVDKAHHIFAIWPGGQCEIALCFGKNERIVKRISKHKLRTDNLAFIIGVDKKEMTEFDEVNVIKDISCLRYAKLRWVGKRLHLLLDQSSSSPTGQ